LVKANELGVEVYKVTAGYPPSEIYGLTSQSRRCCVLVPSNIAEGKRRGEDTEFRRFLLIAFGSGAELETQIKVSKRLPFRSHLDFTQSNSLLEEVQKMLNKLLQKK